MKRAVVKHPLLDNGKETEIFYPIPDDEFEFQIQEIFEAGNYGFVNKQDGVYLDLGANIGMATKYFLNWASKVYAIEPNPQIYSCLVRNIGEDPRVETFNVAWADRTAKAFMYETKGSPAQTLFSREADPKKIEVNCISPKDFFEKNNIGHVDIMKVDVEESEYLIFPDPEFGEVSKNIDVIIGEAHNSVTGGFPEIIPEILKEWGYKTYFPKLKSPNFRKSMSYQNLVTGEIKTYFWDCETIFVATKA